MPTVYGVCRRVLCDRHEAEDAFQATFVQLAQRAAKLICHGTLAGWLHTVARRVALTARRRQDRRRRRELAVGKPEDKAAEDMTWSEIRNLLDAELTRLPEKYRLPLILCYHEDRPQTEAAASLGWPLPTLRGRLERGRQELRRRLARWELPLAAPLVFLSNESLSSELRNATMLSVNSALSGGILAPAIAELAAVRPPLAVRWPMMLAVACFVTLGIGGAITLTRSKPGPPPANPANKQPVPRAEEMRRDQFNDPLPPNAISRMGTVGFRHSARCQELFFALDGKALVSQGTGYVHVWDSETGRALWKRGGVPFIDDENIKTASVIKRGREIFLYGSRREGKIEPISGAIRELDSGRSIRQVPVSMHKGNPSYGSYAPDLVTQDGSALATATRDGEVLLWDADGKPTHVLKNAVTGEYQRPGRFASGSSGTAHGLARFTPDGKSIVTIDDEQKLRVWDVATGKIVRSFGGGAPRAKAMDLSGDGMWIATVAQRDEPGAALATAALPEKVRVWELKTGKLIHEIAWGDESSVVNQLYLAFMPDSASILVVNDRASDSTEVRQWNLSDGKLVRHWQISGRRNELGCIAVHPKKPVFAFGTASGIIRLFDIESGKELTPTGVHTNAIWTVAFAADGRELTTIGMDGMVRIWDSADGRLVTKWTLHGSYAEFAAAAEVVLDGNVFARTGVRKVVVRNARTGAAQREILCRSTFVVSPDGKSIWAVGEDGETLRNVRLESGETAASFKIGSLGRPLTVARDGNLVVTGQSGTITGWDARTGKKVFEWSAKEAKLIEAPERGDVVSDVQISPDGRHVLVKAYRPPVGPPVDFVNLFCCELTTGKIIWRRSSMQDIFGGFQFRPDGKAIACGGWRLRLLDAATGNELVELDRHNGLIKAVAFSPDGKKLASGYANGYATVWDVSKVAP